MKSWITLLLPKDEYQRDKMLHFYGEAAILTFLSLFGLLLYNYYFGITTRNTLLILMVIFLAYILVRYILSGMEFTDVTTLKRYKKKLKEIRMHTATFFILMIIYYFIIGFDSLHGGWFFVLSLGASIFIVRFVSLKRSYKKNRELL